jgi:hypothetical protein
VERRRAPFERAKQGKRGRRRQRSGPASEERGPAVIVGRRSGGGCRTSSDRWLRPLGAPLERGFAPLTDPQWQVPGGRDPPQRGRTGLSASLGTKGPTARSETATSHRKHSGATRKLGVCTAPESQRACDQALRWAAGRLDLRPSTTRSIWGATGLPSRSHRPDPADRGGTPGEIALMPRPAQLAQVAAFPSPCC